MLATWALDLPNIGKQCMSRHVVLSGNENETPCDPPCTWTHDVLTSNNNENSNNNVEGTSDNKNSEEIENIIIEISGMQSLRID